MAQENCGSNLCCSFSLPAAREAPFSEHESLEFDSGLVHGCHLHLSCHVCRLGLWTMSRGFSHCVQAGKSFRTYFYLLRRSPYLSSKVVHTTEMHCRTASTC